jgi:hypothetical protein
VSQKAAQRRRRQLRQDKRSKRFMATKHRATKAVAAPVKKGK